MRMDVVIVLAIAMLSSCTREPSYTAEAPKAETAAVQRLDAFLLKRSQVAKSLVEPIAYCVAQKDTDHAAFHGCIDWHSAAHGTWALVAYTRMTGDRSYVPLIEQTLEPSKIAAERALLASQPDFERPYGRAWFLRLAIEHKETFNSDQLTPFADEVAQSLVDLYTSAPPNPLAQAYGSSSWALINLYDYGVARGDSRLTDFVAGVVRKTYVEGGFECPAATENKEWTEFMAVCTNWAWLVQKVLPAEEFKPWLAKFLPDVGVYKPIENPTSDHQNGQNFSRAWGMWNLYEATGDERYLDAYLGHFETAFSDPDTWKSDYNSVAHWVAQFGMFALMQTT